MIFCMIHNETASIEDVRTLSGDTRMPPQFDSLTTGWLSSAVRVDIEQHTQMFEARSHP